MNIDQAKQIPLSLIVEHLGGTYARTGRNGEIWYHSPFRPEERTASFRINEHTNRWHDFGHVSFDPKGNGGDILDLWCEFHHMDRRGNVKEVLEALAPFSNAPERQPARAAPFRQQREEVTEPDQPRFKVLKLHDRIFFSSLTEALTHRRISPELASLYLKQVYLQDTVNPKWKVNGFAFANHKGGYEISIPLKQNSFKTSTRPKTYSLIAGADKSQANIFEGFWDFLSYLEMYKLKQPNYDCYVLNSLSFCNDMAEHINSRKHEIKKVFLWLDNDEAGLQATHNMVLLFQDNFTVTTKNHVYKGEKNLNVFWTQCIYEAE